MVAREQEPRSWEWGNIGKGNRLQLTLLDTATGKTNPISVSAPSLNDQLKDYAWAALVSGRELPPKNVFVACLSSTRALIQTTYSRRTVNDRDGEILILGDVDLRSGQFALIAAAPASAADGWHFFASASNDYILGQKAFLAHLRERDIPYLAIEDFIPVGFDVAALSIRGKRVLAIGSLYLESTRPLYAISVATDGSGQSRKCRFPKMASPGEIVGASSGNTWYVMGQDSVATLGFPEASSGNDKCQWTPTGPPANSAILLNESGDMLLLKDEVTTYRTRDRVWYAFETVISERRSGVVRKICKFRMTSNSRYPRTWKANFHNGVAYFALQLIDSPRLVVLRLQPATQAMEN